MRREAAETAAGIVEVTAACVLGLVTALTFVSVILRYFFSWSIPDSYDLSRLLLGILIFWGIGVANFRGDHITVDLVWSVVPTRLQQAMDLFAHVVTLGAMVILVWMTAVKVWSTWEDNVLTFDLNLPTWIFYFVAWTALAASVVLLAVRVVRLVLRPESVRREHAIEPIE